jgi:hypothetical protein
MKTMKRILNLVLVSASAAVLAAGCTNDIMDKINENPNNPTDASVNYILPDVMARTAVSLTGGDIALYTSVYMELEAGVHNQMFNAERRVGEPIASSTYNNSWGAFYDNIRYNKTIFGKCDEGSSGGPITKGMAQVIMAVNIATLTNYFGDVPYSQSAEFDASGLLLYPQPAVDTQEDIYKSVFSLLDEAATNLAAGTGAPLNSSDWIYGGNTALWIKAVNALKARYTLQLLKINPSSLDAILGYVNASFANAGEQMTFDQFDGARAYNPLEAFFSSRSALGASKSFVDLLVAKKDPRIMQWGDFEFEDGWADNIASFAGGISAAVNGDPTESQSQYARSRSYSAATAPVHLMSYHELMFIKAEVLARQSKNTEAREALKSAVLAACANMESYIGGGLTPAIAEEYFNNTVAPAFDANPLNEVMLQKYIACSGANAESHVAYDDYRRMMALGDDEYLTLKNPRNAEKQFPLRFPYGADDVAANPNITPLYGDGAYVYTENVWWAGGTR